MTTTGPNSSSRTVCIDMLVLREMHTQVLEKPFWYLDGKKAPDDQDEDHTFSKRLQHLYQRFTERISSYPLYPFTGAI